ncbi:hypothetical protein OROHE_014549 [Orobanche hederae]
MEQSLLPPFPRRLPERRMRYFSETLPPPQLPPPNTTPQGLQEPFTIKISISCSSCALHLPKSTTHFPNYQILERPHKGWRIKHWEAVRHPIDPEISMSKGHLEPVDLPDGGFEYQTRCIGCSAVIKIGETLVSKQQYIISGATAV